MSAITEKEKKALDIMQKDNFRGISKDNVMQLMSILDKVEPEVAKDIIAQFPEVAKLIAETEKGYVDVLKSGIESCDKSTQSCFDSEDDLIKYLQKESEKEGTSFEEKQFYVNKMEEAVKRKEGKDTEHKNMVMSILRFGGEALLAGLIIGIVALGGNTSFRLPKKA